MYSHLIVNVLIIAAVVLITVLTSNPLALFGLFFLKDMPIAIDQDMLEQLAGAHYDAGPEDDESQPMGFTADVK